MNRTFVFVMNITLLTIVVSVSLVAMDMVDFQEKKVFFLVDQD